MIALSRLRYRAPVGPPLSAALFSLALLGGFVGLTLSLIQGGPWAFMVLWLLVVGGVAFGQLFLTGYGGQISNKRNAQVAAMLAVGLIVGIGPAEAQTTIGVLATAGPPHPGLELLETAVVSAGAPPTPNCSSLSREFNNPQAAVNPADPRHLVVTYSIGDGGARVAAASDDSGRSWSGALMPGVTGCTDNPNPEGGLVNDPFLSIGPDARVYASASWVNYDTTTYPAKTGRQVGRGYVSAAPAPGATFGAPVDIDPLVSAQRVPLLAEAGLVTAFYQHASDVATQPVSIATPIGGLDCCSQALPLLGDPLYVRSSTDGGQSYSLLPSVVAEALPGHVHVTIGLQRSGSALVAVRADVDLAQLALARKNNTPIPEKLIAHRSFNQGLTWSTGVTLGTFQYVDSPFNGIPDLTAASDGQLFVTWPEPRTPGTPGTPGRIYVSTSSDGGQSWQKSVAAGVTGDVFEPAVAARGGGRAAVAFYERNGDQVLERIVSTVDGGTSWSPPQSFSAPFSFAALTGSTDGLPVGPFQDLVATPEGYGAAFTTGLAGREAVTFTRFRADRLGSAR